MKDYHFHKVATILINFLTNPVSSLYFTTIKDRLYCDSVHSSRRRSAQYVLLQIINGVLHIIYPMVPHLTEELYEHLPQKATGSYFKRERFTTDSDWKDERVEDVMEVVLKIKGDINREFGAETGMLSVSITLSRENYEKFIVSGFIHVKKIKLIRLNFRNFLLKILWKWNLQTFCKFQRSI